MAERRGATAVVRGRGAGLGWRRGGPGRGEARGGCACRQVERRKVPHSAAACGELGAWRAGEMAGRGLPAAAAGRGVEKPVGSAGAWAGCVADGVQLWPAEGRETAGCGALARCVPGKAGRPRAGWLLGAVGSPRAVGASVRNSICGL